MGWVSATLMGLFLISTISVGARAADEQTVSDAQIMRSTTQQNSLIIEIFKNLSKIPRVAKWR